MGEGVVRIREGPATVPATRAVAWAGAVEEERGKAVETARAELLVDDHTGKFGCKKDGRGLSDRGRGKRWTKSDEMGEKREGGTAQEGGVGMGGC